MKNRGRGHRRDPQRATKKRGPTSPPPLLRKTYDHAITARILGRVWRLRRSRRGSHGRPKFRVDLCPNYSLWCSVLRCVAPLDARRRLAYRSSKNAFSCRRNCMQTSAIACFRCIGHCGSGRGNLRFGRCRYGPHRDGSRRGSRGSRQLRNQPGIRGLPRYPGHPSPSYDPRCKATRYAALADAHRLVCPRSRSVFSRRPSCRPSFAFARFRRIGHCVCRTARVIVAVGIDKRRLKPYSKKDIGSSSSLLSSCFCSRQACLGSDPPNAGLLPGNGLCAPALGLFHCMQCRQSVVPASLSFVRERTGYDWHRRRSRRHLSAH